MKLLAPVALLLLAGTLSSCGLANKLIQTPVRLMQAGAHVIKLEGGELQVETIQFLTERGIAVCAHIGLTPQSVHQLGGFRVQGRGDSAQRRWRRGTPGSTAASQAPRRPASTSS